MVGDAHKREGDAWARMYRVVHGWPTLAGIPIPLFLVMMLLGTTGVFAASMFSGLTASGIVLFAAASAWAVLAWLFRRDQVALPLFVVKRRAPIRQVVSSYSPSWNRLVLDEED